MKLQEETTCIATPGFAGFGGNKYATGDDRFSFPPVPGYTGYIPRSQEHFGKPYVETTNTSLANFQRMLKSKNQLPQRVLAIQAHQAQLQKTRDRGGDSTIKQPNGGASAAATTAASLSASSSSSAAAAGHAITSIPASQNLRLDDMSPYKLPSDHPQKTFISGYTGFVPRLQNHFGEPYSHSVRSAIEEFTHHPAPRNPYAESRHQARSKNKEIVKTSPIPGFTGFIPGSRTCYSMTFGKTAEVAYDQGQIRIEAKLRTTLETGLGKDEWIDIMYVDEKTKQLWVSIDVHLMSFDYITGERLEYVQNITSRKISCFVQHNAYQYTLVGSVDGTIKVMNIVRVVVHEFVSHTKSVTAIAIYPYGPLVLSCGLDYRVRMYNLKSFKEIFSFHVRDRPLEMRLIDDNQLYIQTRSTIEIWATNQINITLATMT
eukprot:jgi/Hompol1/5604/HPOL_001224-RA